MKKIEIMGWTESDVILLEEQDEGSLMLEITPLTLGERSARLFLDDAGRKRLIEFLTPDVKKECDTCRYLETIPSIHEPCYSCNHDYDKWERKS